MSDSGLDVFDRTITETNRWLNAVGEHAGADKRSAYHALRAVLYATRDNLPVTEVAHVASQLPLLVRGIFYEGWRPTDAPAQDRTETQFLERVDAAIPEPFDVSPEAASRAVFVVLRENLTDSQADQVKNMLTQEVQALWPAGFDRSMPGNYPGSENDPNAAGAKNTSDTA